MALVSGLEDIGSSPSLDDIEEGEILDDPLYDDVSSLEDEVIVVGTGPKNVGVVDLTINEDATPPSHKNQRKKDHLCKDGSVCRKERKGKHCHARIRKDKRISNSKTRDAPLDSFNHSKPVLRREESMSSRRSYDKFRSASPPSKMRMDYARTVGTDFKDYLEKENRNRIQQPKSRNRLPDKKRRNSSEKSRSSNYKYTDKSFTWSRQFDYKSKFIDSKPKDDYKSKFIDSKPKDDFKSKYSSSNLIHNAYKNHNDPLFDCTKTSLLKRLVGSGNSGLKTVKDNDSQTKREVLAMSEEEARNSATVSDGNQSAEAITPHLPTPSVDGSHSIEAKSSAEVQKESEAEASQPSEILVSTDNPPEEKTKKSNDPGPEAAEETEPKKKSFDFVWKRSIKEDNDELHLRVEALKSAWLKKFSERKRKGLINQKKENGADDSLADFDLGSSDSEDEVVKDIKPESPPKFNSTDLSGDIIKLEDMVIVGANETIHEDQIVCEPALQVSASSVTDSSVFVPATLVSLLNEGVKTENLPNHNISTHDSKLSVDDKNISEVKENINLNQVSHLRNNITKSDYKSKAARRREKRLRRKRRKREAYLKSMKEIDEERILRENALMSLKMRPKVLRSNVTLPNEQLKIITSPHPKISEENQNTQISPLSNASQNSEPKVLNKKLKTVFESEGTGATSSDNLDDDLDEDILRAQLLSSLSKQVTKISNPLIQQEVRHLNIRKVTPKRQDKRLIRILPKRLWRNNSLGMNRMKFIKMEVKSRPNLKYNISLKKDIRPVINNAPLPSIPPIPLVPKMIISVNDSDSCSEPEMDSRRGPCTVTAEIEANIDLLLQEAKLKNQLEKLAAKSAKRVSTPGVTEDSKQVENTEENLGSRENALVVVHPSVSASSLQNSVTPQALKHLPAWQQEEYKRLKQKIAEKERLLQEVSRVKELELEESGKIKKTEDAVQAKNIEEARPVNADSVEDSKPPESVSLVEAPSDNDPSIKVQTPEPTPNQRLDIHSSDKKTNSKIASCFIMEEINNMNDIVNEFDRNSAEYSELKAKWNKLKKLLKLTEAKMLEKEKKLTEIKDRIQKNERTLSSKINSFTLTQKPAVENIKPASREMELIKLKYKEVSLRAQFLFHDFSIQCWKPDKDQNVALQKPKETEVLVGKKRPADKAISSPLKKKPLKENSVADKGKNISQVPAKRNFSGKEREQGDWDPNTPICHFDLNGICKDQECKYQHFKTV